MSDYTPQPNDVVICEDTTFSMLVESYDPGTRLCALIGIDPATNQAVKLPQVCADSIRLASPNALQVGDVVYYKSGSPELTVANFNEGLADNVDLIGWIEGSKRSKMVQVLNVNSACLVKVNK